MAASKSCLCLKAAEGLLTGDGEPVEGLAFARGQPRGCSRVAAGTRPMRRLAKMAARPPGVGGRAGACYGISFFFFTSPNACNGLFWTCEIFSNFFFFLDLENFHLRCERSRAGSPLSCAQRRKTFAWTEGRRAGGAKRSLPPPPLSSALVVINRKIRIFFNFEQPAPRLAKPCLGQNAITETGRWSTTAA